MSKILILIIKFYQYFISPVIGNNCRFLPTCSEYFIESIKNYGVVKGLGFGVRRILKCHPFKILGGGQVDITSGKFVFNCTEAYEIINGKIGSPIKGATLIGDGPSILKEVSMVGNDMMLDPGIGTCGKAGQGVPVGVAQPSILINKMTVGGTKL